MPARHRFRFTVIGRYQTHLKGNEPTVTISMASGPDQHLTYAGTLTMTEAEWETFVEALRKGLGDDVDIEDRTAPNSQDAASRV